MITVDTLYQVFCVFGAIEKIVMFNKSAGLQGLVQFKNVEDAALAKQQLHSHSLFSNSCTLSIQFSNLSDLTVHQNSDRARDYSKPNLAIVETIPAVAATQLPPVSATTTTTTTSAMPQMIQHSTPSYTSLFVCFI